LRPEEERGIKWSLYLKGLFGIIPSLPLAYHGDFREFVIIGEAVGKLPKSFRKRRPDVEWQDIKDFIKLPQFQLVSEVRPHFY